MKKKSVFKKVFSLMLACLLILAFAPAAVFAADDPISFTTQPKSITGTLGSKVTFTVKAKSADGSSLTYQWYYSKDGKSWSKTTTSSSNTASLSLKVTSEREGYQYCCIATDSKGNTATSKAATLSIKSNPIKILDQPGNALVKVGKTATFKVGVYYKGKDTLSYQWYYSSDDGESWSKTTQTGYDTDTLKVKATKERDGTKYKCKVSDESGNSVTSKAVSLMLDDD